MPNKNLTELKAEILKKFCSEFPSGFMAGHDGDLDITNEVQNALSSALDLYGKAVVERTMKIIEKVVLVDSVGKFNSTPEVGEKFDLEKHNHANRLLNQMNQYIYQSLKSQLDK